MRICILATSTTAHQLGGTEVHAEALAAEAARQGHEVFLATSAHPAGLLTEQKDGYTVIYIPGTDPSMSRGAARLWWEKSVAALSAPGGTGKFDVVWAENYAGQAYAALPRQQRSPVISILQGSLLGGVRSNFNRISTAGELFHFLTRYPAQLALYTIPWFRATVKNSDLIVAVSPQTAAALASEFPASRAKITTILNHVDTEVFRPDRALRAAVRARLELPEDATAVLMTGILHKQKGLALGLECFARTAGKHPGLRLLIVGDGPERKNLEAAAAALGVSVRTIFCGAQGNCAMPGYYNAADIYLNPTLRHEGLPLVMLEAMACGLPSITSRIGGTAATIDDGVSGFFVKPGDTAAMTEKLGLLAGHPELRALLAKNAREKAVRAFDKTLLLQQYLSASRRLILDAN